MSNDDDDDDGVTGVGISLLPQYYEIGFGAFDGGGGGGCG